ncbi:hypothetical protein PENSPDRAFT_758523 [Peniophora sp. CONT]|nr:hypothetical protein PENSPDRAFT_758523 [Peniophora sp. CONT]
MGRPDSSTSVSERPAFRYPNPPNRRRTSTCLPCVGDFVVLTLDPQQSVAHLDDEARQLAAQMTPKNYVALTVEHGMGLPSKFKPTNEFFFAFVRQLDRNDTGLLTGDSTTAISTIGSSPFPASEFSIPIIPCTARSNYANPSLQATAPFPFPDCAIDTSIDSARLRVTTARRDRTPVLPVLFKEVLRLEKIRFEHKLRRQALREAVSDVETRPATVDVASSALSEKDDLTASSLPHDENTVDDVQDTAALMLALASYAGDPDYPVAQIHFDLGAVDRIEDPHSFEREERAILQVILDAKLRMTGIGATPLTLPVDTTRQRPERIDQDRRPSAERRTSSAVSSPAHLRQRSVKDVFQAIRRLVVSSEPTRESSSVTIQPEPDTALRTPSPARAPSPARVSSSAPMNHDAPRAASPSVTKSRRGVLRMSTTKRPLRATSPGPASTRTPARAPASSKKPSGSSAANSMSFTPNVQSRDIELSSPEMSPQVRPKRLPVRTRRRNSKATFDELRNEEH